MGWSPAGIDYGAPDGLPVHLVIMYFVPESQKNSYLKEISSLAKAIQTQPELQDLKSLSDLAEVRHRLLDAITIALESTGPGGQGAHDPTRGAARRGRGRSPRPFPPIWRGISSPFPS